MTTALLVGLAATTALAQGNPTKTAIYNDGFINASYLAYKPFLAKYKPTLFSKRKRANVHDPKEVDYLLTYALGNDKCVFYQTPRRTFAVSFVATSKKLVLARGVRVGMTKRAFEAAFRRPVANTTTVTNAEQFQRYTFTFTKNRLSSIVYHCSIEY